MLLPALIVGFNCQSVPSFPEHPFRTALTDQHQTMYSYDLDKNQTPDYWQLLNDTGRKVELRFNATADRPPEVIKLKLLNNSEIPHFIMALDGVPFELVNKLFQDGSFRLFYPPSKVISCFPSMTDLAFQRVFGGDQPLAYQAKHFDRHANRIIPGNEVYLNGQNADWNHKLDYRCSTSLDAVAYVNPQYVFQHELNEILKVFRQTENGQRIVYLVGTAGLGTQGGREAILNYLRVIDRLCEQIIYERRGRVKITLLADHGHNMSGRGRVRFDQLLEESGFRLHDRLESPYDVVSVDYGLVTYAALFTHNPAQVAQALLRNPVVNLACFPMDQSIVVQCLAGKARIRHARGRFSYTVEYGDPLRLLPCLEQLRQQGNINPNGFVDDRTLFLATVDHIYPDPLRRIWMAFHGLVQKPPDLIVCLKDGWCHGSAVFDLLIGGASSTHGSLNQINSATFLMTMLGPTPSALRLEDIMPALNRLRSETPINLR